MERDVKRVGYIVVSSDKGLCGGLNVNLFRALVKDMKSQADAGVEIDLALVGKKAQAFFRSYGGNVVATVEGLGETPTMEEPHRRCAGDAARVRGGSHRPTGRGLQPFREHDDAGADLPAARPAAADRGRGLRPFWDYLYEPDARELIEGLIKRYIESEVYQAVVENTACEQAAKMIAMKNATENAGQLIDDLQLLYNNARQAAITQEISEIVGGAAAV